MKTSKRLKIGNLYIYLYGHVNVIRVKVNWGVVESYRQKQFPDFSFNLGTIRSIRTLYPTISLSEAKKLVDIHFKGEQ